MPGSSLNQLYYPRDVSLDQRSNTLYVCDCWNQRITRFTPNSTVGVVVAGDNAIGNQNYQLNMPFSVHFDSSTESLFILNSEGQNLVRWPLNTSYWTLVSGNTVQTSGTRPNQFYYPYKLTMDPMSNIYVADTGNNRIQFFTPNNSNGTTIAGAIISGASANLLDSPYGVALDSRMNLYVADAANCRIQKFSFN